MIIEHGEYIARVEYDPEDEVFHGEVQNLRDVVSFQGRSVKELRKAFADSITFYEETCHTHGKEPERPLSGKFLVRVPPESHRAIVGAASRESKSVNAWVRETLERAAGVR